MLPPVTSLADGESRRPPARSQSSLPAVRSNNGNGHRNGNGYRNGNGDKNSSLTSLPPLRRSHKLDAPFHLTFLRFFVWAWAVLFFAAGWLGDLITGRDSLSRRARRLRLTMESLGPTFIKVGQQMSVRADVLPIEYCEELQKMLDNVPAMPFRDAVAAIERLTGKPLDETFAEFNPKPIGSASLACVYKARLYNGDQVAVKIMRPGVGLRMSTELRALGWLMKFVEITGALAKDMAVGIHAELDVMLKEELNFRREARNAEIFRNGAIEDKQFWFTAPLVYWDLLGEDVLVVEFIEGKSVNYIINAVAQKDEDKLAELAEMGINHKETSKRLARALHWELNEALLFHGDPHPANILVRPGGQLVFIDFGSCGKMVGKFHRTWQQFYLNYTTSDVGSMVEGVLQLLEPLPNIEPIKFAKDLENALWDYIHANKSRYSEWHERASGALWMRFAEVARKHSVPMSVDTIRLFRATFLYDTAIFRLWGDEGDPEPERQYRDYLRNAGKRAKKRVMGAIRTRLENGLKPEDYLRLEETWRLGQQYMANFQHLMDLPQAAFGAFMSKLSFVAAVVLRIGIFVLCAGLGLWLAVGLYNYEHDPHEQFDLYAKFTLLLQQPPAWLKGLGVVFGVVFIMKLLQRIEEVDPHSNNQRWRG